MGKLLPRFSVFSSLAAVCASDGWQRGVRAEMVAPLTMVEAMRCSHACAHTRRHVAVCHSVQAARLAAVIAHAAAQRDEKRAARLTARVKLIAEESVARESVYVCVVVVVRGGVTLHVPANTTHCEPWQRNTHASATSIRQCDDAAKQRP
jgi:hypothetical protein